MTPASKHLAHIRAIRLEAPAQRKGLGAETFRGFQLAEELFLLTSFFIEPEGQENFEVKNIWLRKHGAVRVVSHERCACGN